MKVFVKAKTRAKMNALEMLDATHFTVAVTVPPVDNQANEVIIKMIATHFKVAPLRVRIVSGISARRKVLEII